MQTITPCLWFHRQAEEAAEFYASLFANSRIREVARYGNVTSAASGMPRDSAMTVLFELDGQAFLGLNGGPQVRHTPAASLFVHCPTAGEADRLWKALSDGGTTLMPLDRYPFSEKYGWLQDRFGVSWQLILARSDRTIAPCFLFVNERYGQAEAAMNFYLAQFEGSKVLTVSRYGPNEHGTEGSFAHAKFTLADQEIVVMDGPGEHRFTFTPAFSLIVHCQTQAEIDRFWAGLSDGGREDQCGWLQDRFGVSWQVVPAELGSLVTGGSPERAERVMGALLEMKKLDLEGLRAAAAK